VVAVVVVVVVVMGVGGVCHRGLPSRGRRGGRRSGMLGNLDRHSAEAMASGRGSPESANFFFASSSHCWNFALDTASIAIGM